MRLLALQKSFLVWRSDKHLSHLVRFRVTLPGIGLRLGRRLALPAVQRSFSRCPHLQPEAESNYPLYLKPLSAIQHDGDCRWLDPVICPIWPQQGYMKHIMHYHCSWNLQLKCNSSYIWQCMV